MKKLNKKGFTLVELLAVIVVLALLMVVATRTVGSSLTNSKRKAMQTELNKVVSKTYEEANAGILLHSTLTADDFSYDIGTGAGFASNKLKGKEGDYSYTVTIDTSSSPIVVSGYCITDGKNGYSSTATTKVSSVSGGNSIIFSSEAFDTNGTGSSITQVTACS